MGCTCGTYSCGAELRTGVWWGNLKVRDQLEHTGVDGRIILQWMSNKIGEGGGVD